jgi:hypothetical protein
MIKSTVVKAEVKSLTFPRLMMGKISNDVYVIRHANSDGSYEGYRVYSSEKNTTLWGYGTYVNLTDFTGSITLENG